MMRTMHAGLRTLQRMQAERQKAEDAMRPAAMLRAGHLHSSTLPPEPDPPPSAPEPPPPTEPNYETMTEAEQYAVLYPDHAAAIRQHSGMPPGAEFPPPDRAITNEIATGNSPVFRSLDPMLPSGYATESATPSHAMVP